MIKSFRRRFSSFAVTARGRPRQYHRRDNQHHHDHHRPHHRGDADDSIMLGGMIGIIIAV